MNVFLSGGDFVELIAEFVRELARESGTVAAVGLPAVVVIAIFTFVIWGASR